MGAGPVPVAVQDTSLAHLFDPRRMWYNNKWWVSLVVVQLVLIRADRLIVLRAWIVCCIIPCGILVPSCTSFSTWRVFGFSLFLTHATFPSAAWTTCGAFKMDSTWTWRLPSLLQGLSSVLQLDLVLFAPESLVG